MDMKWKELIVMLLMVLGIAVIMVASFLTAAWGLRLIYTGGPA